MVSSESCALRTPRTQSTSIRADTWWARSPTAAGLALGAVTDLLFADPRHRHPVAGFGQAAAALERRLWRDSRAAGGGYAAAGVGAAAALGAGGARLPRSR